MGQVLGIIYRCIATRLIKKSGFYRKSGQIGVVTLIQRFGRALNLNVHFERAERAGSDLDKLLIINKQTLNFSRNIPLAVHFRCQNVVFKVARTYDVHA
jgi:hypothetical protein